MYGGKHSLRALTKIPHLGKLRQESQSTLQDERKGYFFLLHLTTVRIETIPLPRKLLIFIVSACFLETAVL